MSEYRLYFIGAGPSAPDLITLRGLNALKKSKSVFLADSYKDSFAEYLTGKELYVPFEYLFDEIIDLVKELLQIGDVAFLLPGDLTIFSPFQSFISYYEDSCTVIPGVGSLNAAAAILKKTLDLPKISGSIIITSPRSITKTGFTKELSELMRRDSTLVLFMNNMPSERLKEELLKKYPITTPVAIVHNISMPGENTVITTIEKLPDDVDDEEYFNISRLSPCMSLVIVGDIVSATGDPKFWNYRKINIWDKRNPNVSRL